ncbi:MAG TPA: hypothetical protein VGL78_15230 [Solirubrobacteraceae bacterium]
MIVGADHQLIALEPAAAVCRWESQPELGAQTYDRGAGVDAP